MISKLVCTRHLNLEFLEEVIPLCFFGVIFLLELIDSSSNPDVGEASKDKLTNEEQDQENGVFVQTDVGTDNLILINKVHIFVLLEN